MTAGRIVIAGGTGLLGTTLIAALRAERPDAEVVILTRDRGEAEAPGSGRGDERGAPRLVTWRPDADAAALERLAAVLDGASAVVNLAGASLGAGRLGPAHLARVRESRLQATRTLVAASRRAPTPPAVFVQGSAIGVYGDRGDEELSERSALASGDGLVASSRAAEQVAASAAEHGRLVVARTALALHPDSPFWKRMILPVRFFVGGPLGSGRQWMSWITAEDHARALIHVIEHANVAGPVNFAAPQPLRQADLVRAVARRLRRPAFVPVPAPLLRLVLGRLADATVLQSARVVPERLLGSGFRFRHATFDAALTYLLPERTD